MSVPSGQWRLNINVIAATVGVASAQVIAASQVRGGLLFHNASSTASLAITTVTFGAAALNTAGSITLGPLGFLEMDVLRSLDAFNAIASAANTPLTIWEF